MADDELTATVYSETAAIPAKVWNGLVPGTSGKPSNPFLDHAFFLALEQSGCAVAKTGWQPQHILVERNGTPVGLMPLYLKSHSQGEYVFDYAWADAFQRAGGRYYPKLQASVPFTPASAEKLIAAPGDLETRAALLTSAGELASRIGASSVHATFVTSEEERIATELGWLNRHDIQFHWHNQGFDRFDDFLGTMSSRKRKTLRRERREALASGIRIEWLTGPDLQEAHWDAFFAFYMDTGNRKWGRPYLNRDFFSLISAAMADRIVLMIAYDGDEPIAGALNFLGDDTLYGRNWGALRHVPFLHFEVCYYQAIDFAIAHGLKTVEAGAQGEHKLARGYEPTQTRSIHFIANPSLREAVSDYLIRERDVIARDQDVLAHHTPFRKGPEGGGPGEC